MIGTVYLQIQKDITDTKRQRTLEKVAMLERLLV